MLKKDWKFSKLSITVDAARRKLRIIRNAGIGIGIDVNHYGLGLVKLFIIVEGIWDRLPTPLSYVIKWRAHIISPRPSTMMLFYQPINVSKEYILNALKDMKITNVFEAQLTVCNKPNFVEYFDPQKKKFTLSWRNWKCYWGYIIFHF